MPSQLFFAIAACNALSALPGSPPSAGSFVPAGGCVTSVENFRSIVYVVAVHRLQRLRREDVAGHFRRRVRRSCSAVIRLPVISTYCVIVSE